MKYADLTPNLQQLVLNLIMKKAENGGLRHGGDAVDCLEIVVDLITADIPVGVYSGTTGETDPSETSNENIDWELVHDHQGKLSIYKHPTDPTAFMLTNGDINAVIKKENVKDKLPPCEVLISMLKAAGKPN